MGGCKEWRKNIYTQYVSWADASFIYLRLTSNTCQILQQMKNLEPSRKWAWKKPRRPLRLLPRLFLHGAGQRQKLAPILVRLWQGFDHFIAAPTRRPHETLQSHAR